MIIIKRLKLVPVVRELEKAKKSNLGIRNYETFINDIKGIIHKKQYEVIKKINSETITLYWEIGKEIQDKQKEQGWGKGVVEILSKELQKEFPGAKGYSAGNLWRMKNFYLNYCDSEKLAPLVREISWSNNIVIMEKCKDDLEREFYIQMTKRYGWSKRILTNFIEAKTFEAEYAGKMQLYLEVLDEKVKLPEENSSIGIIICKNKDKTFVEYALRRTNAPIGVATYQLRNTLPEDMKNILPAPNEIIEKLKIFE